MYTVDNHTVQECTEYYCTYEIKCDTLHKALVIQLQSHHDNISYTLNSFILTLQRLQPTKKKKKKKKREREKKKEKRKEIIHNGTWQS